MQTDMRGLAAQFPPASLQTPEVRTTPPLDLFLIMIPGACDLGPEADNPTRACWTAEGGRKSRWVPRLRILILRQRSKYGGRRRGECDEPHDHPNLSGYLDFGMRWEMVHSNGDRMG